MRLGPYSRRALWARPGRTLLTVASVVIGVAAVVAVTVVTASTRQSYSQLFAELHGNASLEIVSPASASIPQDLVDLADHTPGVKAAVPLVQQWSALRHGEQRVRLQCLGIDPGLDHYVRGMEIVDGHALEPGDEDKLLLVDEFAEQLGIGVGDNVRLLTKRRFRGEAIGPVEMEVVGLVKITGGSALAQSGVAFMSLHGAQRRFLGNGLVDAVQVVAAEGAEIPALQAALQAQLPAGLVARPPQGNSSLLQGTLDSTEQGLRLATMFSLIMAGFIILNTFLMNVGERRRQLAILRVIGATRRQLLWALLGESLLLGTIGTVVGIGVGLAAAWLLTDSLSRVLDVPLPPAAQFLTSPAPYALGVAHGLILSLAGALVPALRAQSVTPLEGMSWVSPADLAAPRRRNLVFGLLLLMAGAGVIVAGVTGLLSLVAPVFGAGLLLISVVLLLPYGMAPLTWLAAWPTRIFGSVETGLATRQVLRHRGRSALTAGVLFIAGSTGVGMAHSILDNVQDVRNWYQRVMIGDFYVRALMPDFSTGAAADLPEDLDARLRALPGIDYLDRIKLLEAQVVATSPAAAPATEPTATAAEPLDVIFVVREYSEPGPLSLELVAGDESRLRQQMRQGEVVVGTVLAHRMGWQVGDTFTIAAVDGERQVKIGGITNEYLAAGQGIYAEWGAAEKLFGIHGADGYIIRADHAQLDQLRPQLAALAQEYGVLLHSTADIAQHIDRIITAIDAGLWGLVVLGFLVASFGVVNTLSMSVLEQTRELAMLRIIAMTGRQVRRTIVAQAALLGCIGLAPGVAAGISVAYVMNLAMEPSFGRPIAFGFHPWLLVSTLFGALAVVLIAARLPAERAARIEIGQALHYE